MKAEFGWLPAVLGCVLLLSASCRDKVIRSATVPMALDHNRMLVEAEIQRKDGSWRKALLWVDTGNPDFFMSPALARDLGIDLSAQEKAADGTVGALEVPPPSGVRMDGMPLNFQGVKSMVMFEPSWLFGTMHNDGNLPSTVMKQYQVVFDYPGMRFTIAQPGTLRPKGTRVEAKVHPSTGIVQIDVVIGKDSLSLALDNGASYSFTSVDVLESLSRKHADWPRCIGAVGCANIWGWWPEEEAWPVMRVPEILCGTLRLADVGIVGLPNFFPNGSRVGDWYSRKTARPVAGFLGPNAFKAFRIFMDFTHSAVWFEKGAQFDSHDMDLVGLTLRLEADGRYCVIGISKKDGRTTVEGVAPGDVLLNVDGLSATHATMGTVVDNLRGKPGDVHTLDLERDGKPITVQTKVERLL